MPIARKQEISSELRHLVSASGALLGEVIRKERGEKEYRFIERTRREMANLRGLSLDQAYRRLQRKYQELEALSPEQRHALAHAFSLLLELMNACENAYRAYRLRERPHPRFKTHPEAIISVLTAHPTEARSPENVEIFHRIQELLTRALERDWENVSGELEHWLELAWRISIARNRKPSVEDEADYLYSILLKPETLNAILAANEEVPFYFRSWVGGDKDGHPGVDQRKTRSSLAASRRRLHEFAHGLLNEIEASVELLHSEKLKKSFQSMLKNFRELRVLEPGDGARVVRFRQALRVFSQDYQRTVRVVHPALLRLRKLFHVFPALVIPLELREDSGEIQKACLKRRQPIERMLLEVRALSRGGSPRGYARGLVISMTRDLHDIEAACTLVRRTLGGLLIPVIPLFEQAEALEESPGIVDEMLRDPDVHQSVHRHWNGFLEVMLGYSDSAKQMGVLPSRLAISDAMSRLDRVCRRHKVRPLFFHGSGGSVDRGGGSIEEQTSGWPESALSVHKVTVQGEMVERTFATPEITFRQMEAIVSQWESRRKRLKSAPGTSPLLKRFAAKVSGMYRAQVHSPEFLEVVQRSTPYSELQKLRIGSRPTKRSGTLSVSSLRAIPWVLCWTQTRTLFPTWWGIGTAWISLSPSEKREMKKVFREDALFRSFVKLLGFTLAKVELPIWRLYLEHSGLPRERITETFRQFEQEYRASVQFVHAVSGERNLLWYRTWLAESIRLRSPMIHPLNLLQIANRGSRDVLLTRETVTGISSGMLTTG